MNIISRYQFQIVSHLSKIEEARCKVLHFISNLNSLETEKTDSIAISITVCHFYSFETEMHFLFSLSQFACKKIFKMKKKKIKIKIKNNLREKTLTLSQYLKEEDDYLIHKNCLCNFFFFKQGNILLFFGQSDMSLVQQLWMF